MNTEIESLEHGVTSVQTSGDASRSRYTETHHNWDIQLISSHCTIIVTYINMDMVIVVYECGRGWKCVYKLTYTNS